MTVKTPGPSQERGPKDFKSQRPGRIRVKMSSGHDRYVAVMNSQQLCVLAQALHRITAITILAWKGEGLTSPHPYPNNY